MKRSSKGVHGLVFQKLLVGLSLAALVAAGSAVPQGANFLVKGPFVPPENAPEYAADRVIVKFVNELPPAQIDALLNRFVSA